MELTPLGMQADGSFRFNIPGILKKGGDGRIWLEGEASVETPDIANETVLMDGLDLNYFLKRGFFNDNHDKSNSGKIGIPVEAKVVKGDGPNRLFVKGYFLDTPRAQAVIELGKALEKSGGERKLGFSVEGKVLQRDGKIIRKSWLKDIAVTAEPVHPDTYCNIVKSVSQMVEKMGMAVGPEDQTERDRTFLGQIKDVVSDAVAAKLEAFKKSLPPGGGAGGSNTTSDVALIKESLEQDPPQYLADEDKKRAEKIKHDLLDEDESEDEDEGRMTKAQVVQFLIEAKGYTAGTAKRAAALFFDGNFRAALR